MIWPRIRRAIMDAQNVALCVARKWWRPIGCWSVSLGALVNLVIIPLYNWTVPNMAEAAAYVTALAAMLAIREWGKIKGVQE